MAQKKKPSPSGPDRHDPLAKPARAAAAETEKTTSGKSSRPSSSEHQPPGARRSAPGGDDRTDADKGGTTVSVRKDVNRELIEEIRIELLRKKIELGSNISTELDEMRDAAEGHHLADMDDLGGDAHDEETQYKIIEIESAQLDQIDYALDRMASGTYGVCETCDKAIAPERLKALPFATLCIGCKRQQEREE